jgi:hypothetical protein
MDKAPLESDKTLIPGYRDGTVKIGSFFKNLKEAKKGSRRHQNGIYAEVAKLLDQCALKWWHDWVATIEPSSVLVARNVKKRKSITAVEQHLIQGDHPDEDAATPEHGDERTNAVETVVDLADEGVNEDDDNNEDFEPKKKRSAEKVFDLAKEDVDDDNEEEEPKKKLRRKCRHKWTCVDEDEYFMHQACELCGRCTKKSRIAASKTYDEPNPDKKRDINAWLATQSYLPGKAVILDAGGMQTTDALVRGKRFRVEDIVVPEYDDDVYDVNSAREDYGQCLRRGDFLAHLKKQKPDELSLIYADFTGRYDKFVRPLFEYIGEHRDVIRDDTILGVTWSNNGAGTPSERAKIERDIGKFAWMLHFQLYEDPIVSETGYGQGGNMNVQFMKRRK